jgi:4-hydroxythreonine-4-phosphate dehydrogenase
MPERPRLVISSGDPAGIGPEVTAMALANTDLAHRADIVVTGDPSSLEIPAPARVERAGDASKVEVGKVSAAAGEVAVQAIKRAVELIEAGDADAIVTAPISKEALREAGYSWPGHTEMLAELTGVEDVRMLLVGGQLRVVHVTTHRSLRSAIEAATRDRVRRTIEVAEEGGKVLALDRRRIGVAGLNPHAGENGMFGDEEIEQITPAVEDARAKGIDAVGPIPADTLFWRATKGEFDLVVAMYHDQGHIPIKLGGFSDGVNVSLGLPFLRTSVDHGTAFDIAGKGVADWRSMATAIELAIEVLERQTRK